MDTDDACFVVDELRDEVLELEEVEDADEEFGGVRFIRAAAAAADEDVITGFFEGVVVITAVVNVADADDDDASNATAVVVNVGFTFSKKLRSLRSGNRI